MNGSIKGGITSSQASYMNLRAALFHSTPVLERRRRNHWQPSWKDFVEDDPFSSSGPSWFKRQHSKGSQRNGKRNQRQKDNRGYWESHCWGRRGFQFCEDDFEFTGTFRSIFGGNSYFYWSFIQNENPYWFNSSRYSNYRRSWNWRYRVNDEYDSSTESESSEPDLASDRLALGLNASGPLTLDDVKKAYRTCALKWHPDRHQGSNKVVAEEKFKRCSSAYQSLCDKLSMA